MYQHIGIAMPEQALCMRNLNAAQPQGASFNETMDIVTKAHPDLRYKITHFSLEFWKIRTKIFFAA
jgi:hypothetical protein